ncbi:MAG TPA: aminoacyl-tRNA hydrolase [Sedimentisphaerales bacterium]|nr:aminoacyl-tRNA hydrolase [Sedimentisphaerales bacterium]HOV76900.1 aminoacyl-tRNA hydrolase [Sedimentisphaerales bacterium]
MAELRLVAGLGNPGSEYAETRHNLGFKVIEALEDALGIEVKQRKFNARIGEGVFEGTKVILMKPWQFMNRSGESVATALGFYKLDRRHLMVVVDDRALEPGVIRIRAKGSAGGHNGLADIIEKLGSNEFPRCRVGIGQCAGAEAIGYVLGRPTPEERPLLNGAVLKARDAVLYWLRFGLEKTMNEFNRAQEQ